MEFIRRVSTHFSISAPVCLGTLLSLCVSPLRRGLSELRGRPATPKTYQPSRMVCLHFKATQNPLDPKSNDPSTTNPATPKCQYANPYVPLGRPLKVNIYGLDILSGV